MIDDQEEQVANSAARLERSRVKYERLNKIIVSMKAGNPTIFFYTQNINYINYFFNIDLIHSF